MTFILSLLLGSPGAWACSCAGSAVPRIETCRTSPRVFGGVVVANDWPWTYELVTREPMLMELEVRQVWRGEVPSRVIARTGHCGFPVATGTPFVVCDDGNGPPIFSFCDPPALDSMATKLQRDLGQFQPPSPSRVLLPPIDRQLMLVPLASLFLLGAGGGAWWRRWRGTTEGSPSFIPGLLLVPAGRAAAHSLIHRVYGLPEVAPMLLLVGLLYAVVGWQGQRRGGGRILLQSLMYMVTLAWLGFGPLHLPFQPDGTACSTERARSYLAGRPPVPAWWDRWQRPPESEAEAYQKQMELWRAEVDRRSIPHACIDLGLFPMKVIYDRDLCLEFPDGDGGVQRVCADPRYDGVRWEREMF